uniref:Fatty acyl-CoA reductase n=1 Tax=Timema californicum TaxID=61474 RepID=A0A7R9JBE5_TIMCA|nr:unnamed protein product [Timema californicum]
MDSQTGHLGESKFEETDNDTCNKGTDIQEFYRDCNVLITGGTGFVGKLLIEKLLRSCPATKNIFTIIRPKKGKSPEERKEKLLKCVIFDSLKATSPNFHEKLVMVSGDISLPNLGISTLDYEMLSQQVNIIFHLAATVKFDEKINIAVPINIFGTMEIIKLCRKCVSLKMLSQQVNIIFHLAATVKFDEKVNIAVPINIFGTMEIIKLCRKCVSLKSIVYVSTAYSNCHLKEIKERFYNPPIEEYEIIKYLTTVDEVIMEIGRTHIHLLKLIAENIIRKTASDLPISIVRPSQVAGTLKEPLIGWIDNIYGPNGAVVGIGAGLLKTIIRKGNLKSDVIPGDLVINGIIVAAYDVGTRNYEEIPIFNSVCGMNAITFEKSEKILYERMHEVPSKQSIWCPSMTSVECSFWFRFVAIFIHVIPGAILDLLLIFKGKNPMIVKIYRKVDKFMHSMKYFTTFEWDFDNHKYLSLYNSLSESDKEIFYFNSNEIIWKDY